VAMLVFPRIFYKLMRARRIKKFVAQLPDAMTLLSGSMRAGASLQMAMDLVVNESPAPLSQEFSLILREQRLGLPLEDSLDGMAKRLQVEDVDLFVSAMTIAKEVGGNLSEILDRLASMLRAKASMEGKIDALTSQGKLQGIVVGCLPVLLGFVLYAMEPEAMEPMFSTYYGWGVMAAIAIFLFLGGFFIRKIVTIDI
jgi:tight adherence protein B